MIGGAIGSFLAVVVFRNNPDPKTDKLTKKEKNFISSRSFCDSCKKQLNWFDMVPVVSFLLQSGKCRYCKKKINSSYFIMELVSGLVAVVFCIHYYSTPTLDFIQMIFEIFLAYFFIFLGYYDYLYWEVPLKSLFGASIFVLFYLILGLVIGTINVNVFMWALLAGIIGILVIVILIVISRGRGLGWGDAWVFGLVGLSLGLKGMLLVYLVAVFCGAIIGIYKAFLIQKFRGVLIQFIPFICVGVLVAIFDDGWIFGILFPYL